MEHKLFYPLCWGQPSFFCCFFYLYTYPCWNQLLLLRSPCRLLLGDGGWWGWLVAFINHYIITTSITNIKKIGHMIHNQPSLKEVLRFCVATSFILGVIWFSKMRMTFNKYKQVIKNGLLVHARSLCVMSLTRLSEMCYRWGDTFGNSQKRRRKLHQKTRI